MDIEAGDAVDAVLNRLLSLDLLPPDSEWVGCSADELDDIERAIGRPLSFAHRHFLSRLGHMAGARFHRDESGRVIATSHTRLFAGSAVFWPDAADLTHSTDELLAAHDLPPLATNCVAVLVHQGYIAFWTVGPDANPPVWAFAEGQTPAPELAYPAFSAWLLELGMEWAGLTLDQ